jgi:hypothetical protein
MELLRQEGAHQGHNGSAPALRDLLIPWIEDWCRKAPGSRAPGIRMSGGDQATVHTRLQEPHHLLAWEDFAIELKKSRQNMAQVLRALVREHIQPMRRDLDTAVRRREAAARRRRYRKAFRKSLSDAIGEFLVEARGRSTVARLSNRIWTP